MCPGIVGFLMKFPGFVGALDIRPLQLSGVVQVLKYLLLFGFFAHIPLVSLELHNTEVPWHTPPNHCVPFDGFCPFCSQPSFFPGNSKVLSEGTSCPTTQQPPLLVPWVFSPIFPSHSSITFHPTLWMPRTLATPSGQQQDRKKWRNNVLQRVT